MKDTLGIRNETNADVSAIAEVTVAAFETLAISNHTEQFIIAALRAAFGRQTPRILRVSGRNLGPVLSQTIGLTGPATARYPRASNDSAGTAHPVT